MPLPTLVAAFRDLPGVRTLLEALPAPRRSTALRPLPGSAGAVLVAAIAEAQPQRLLAVLTPAPPEAERWLADLTVLLGEAQVALYPQREGLGEDEPHYEIAGERVETLEQLTRGGVRVLVTTARATAERTLMPAALEAARLEIAPGSTFRAVTERLDRLGYARSPHVTDVAQYSVRGGIVDVYGFGMAEPARGEFWGEELVSLRTFDLGTQRSLGPLERVTVLPVDPRASLGDAPGTVRRSLLDMLPSGALLVEEGPDRLADEIARAWTEAEHHAEVARRLGEDVPPREELLLPPERCALAREGFARLLLGVATAEQALPVGPPPAVTRDLSRLRPPAGERALVLCDNEGQIERLEELLTEGPGRFPDGLSLALGALDGGFALPGLAVFTDHEVFRRARRIRRPRRYRVAPPAGATEPLKPGDVVVHLDHGIGIYRGIQTIQVSEGTLDVAAVEYEGGDFLHVPLYRIDQLERYRSVEAAPDAPAPKLHHLGGKRWKRQRDQVQAAINRLAVDLLDLYARRQVVPGFAFPADTRWQRELESSFLYEDTPDQRDATEAVKRDMERPRPMDRLVVGDVGYGKTEVAVRAAFKAVQAGKQVAVLAPTTILAEQHGRTFGERLADYPVRLFVLSRFRGAKEQKAALAALAAGTVDIVIGTHRLLSADVLFKDLGLIVVDEQHRFGVEQRHALRSKHPDGNPPHVLVMTATPIPRTVAMTVFGDLDTSTLSDMPRGRSPISTTVVPAADRPAWVERAWQRIREEVAKGHQAYVVCPKIGDDDASELFEDGSTFDENADEDGAAAAKRPPLTVTQVAAMLHDGPLLGLRLGILHGRLPPGEKDEVMTAFAAGELDVLVATTVIEVGVDVPNASMMVIMDAERFGMSQLHQLRGRVGRGRAPGICLLISEAPQGSAGRTRLAAVEATSDGFELAEADLELRREGNVLGTTQAGRSTALKQLSLRRDREVIEQARTDSLGLVGDDPEMTAWPGLADMVSLVIASENQEYLDKG